MNAAIIFPAIHQPKQSWPVRRAITLAEQAPESPAPLLWRLWAYHWRLGIDRSAEAARLAVHEGQTDAQRHACMLAVQLAQGDGMAIGDIAISSELDQKLFAIESMIAERFAQAAHAIARDLAHEIDAMSQWGADPFIVDGVAIPARFVAGALYEAESVS